MPSETQIAEENRRHEHQLTKLKEDFEQAEREVITGRDKEHIDAEIFVGIAIALEVIATLLVAGELIGKSLAIAGAIGVGIFSIGLIIWILVESKGDIAAIYKAYAAARDAENAKHDAALKVP